MPPSFDDEPKEDSSLRRKRLLREAQRRYRERYPDRVKDSKQRCETKESSKEKKRLRQRQGRLQTRLKAIALLGGKCTACQQSFHHAAMDFHHVDSATKEIKGRGIPAGNSWEKVQKELSKTVLLCANCHRIHHYKEQNPDE